MTTGTIDNLDDAAACARELAELFRMIAACSDLMAVKARIYRLAATMEQVAAIAGQQSDVLLAALPPEALRD